MAKNKVYVPGEIITTEEEYAAGKNTFEDNGYIKSSGFGEAEFDENNKEVKIKSKDISILKSGDIVLGQVSMVKDSVVVIEIIKAEEEGKAVIVTKGQIPARMIANYFVSDLKKIFKVGDIVRAKVVASDDLAIDLTTQGEGLGVILAHCSRCRSTMKYSNGKLACFSCGSIEERKWFEAKDERTFRDNAQEGGFKRNNDFRPNNRSNFRNNDRHNSKNRDGFRNNKNINFRGERR